MTNQKGEGLPPSGAPSRSGLGLVGHGVEQRAFFSSLLESELCNCLHSLKVTTSSLFSQSKLIKMWHGQILPLGLGHMELRNVINCPFSTVSLSLSTHPQLPADLHLSLIHYHRPLSSPLHSLRSPPDPYIISLLIHSLSTVPTHSVSVISSVHD